MPDKVPEGMPDRMPDKMSDRMPEDMPDKVPECLPDRMPEDMPDNMPEDMPDRMPEDMPGRMPEDMPEHMPDRMPEDMSDRMPEDLPVTKCINVMVGITRSKVILLKSTFSVEACVISLDPVRSIYSFKTFFLYQVAIGREWRDFSNLRSVRRGGGLHVRGCQTAPFWSTSIHGENSLWPDGDNELTKNDRSGGGVPHAIHGFLAGLLISATSPGILMDVSIGSTAVHLGRWGFSSNPRQWLRGPSNGSMARICGCGNRVESRGWTCHWEW